MAIRRSSVLFAVCSLLVVQVALSMPALAVPVMRSVNCPTDSLAAAITAASPGDTLVINGTCVGNFAVGKRLTFRDARGCA